MSLTSRLLGLTNCGDTDVLQRFDLSTSETVYSGLLLEYRRDVENEATDLTRGKDPIVRTLTGLFLDQHGVSKRVNTDNKPVDGLGLSMLVERALAKEGEKRRPVQILDASGVANTELRLAQLRTLRQSKVQALGDSGLEEIEGRIDEHQEKLERHLLGLMKYGYFMEFMVSSEGSIRQNLETAGQKAEDQLEKALEGLVSRVVSLSVQHGVTLPEPNLESMKDFIGRISWCQECIDKLVKGVASQDVSPTREESLQKEAEAEAGSSPSAVAAPSKVDELRTALNDLRFAHVYLARQYEDERSRYNKSLNQLRLKLSQSQELLAGSNDQLTRQTQQSLKLEMKLNEALSELRENKKELHQKNLQINLLKVDQLAGNNSNGNGSADTTVSSPHESVSSMSTNNVSAPILRMEFKKLVGQMNEDFEKELDKERVERRRLEDLVRLYEDRSAVVGVGKRAPMGLMSPDPNAESVHSLPTPPSNT